MHLIDCRHLGNDRVIGCWQVGDSLVDPGPERCLETLLTGVEGEPRRLLLTHIHLDHAGAAGALVERFPDLEVLVHETGAPHLADPSRLLASAEQLYGDRMEVLWGRVAPVPEANLRPLSGGERLDGGVEVLYTPGHARHHVTYLLDGTAFVGDVAGVRIPPSDYRLMPTPPPDIDVEAWIESIERVRAAGSKRLALTHFGLVEDPESHLDAASASLRFLAGLAHDASEAEFVAALHEALVAESDPVMAARYEQIVPPDQIYKGLRRYLNAD